MSDLPGPATEGAEHPLAVPHGLGKYWRGTHQRSVTAQTLFFAQGVIYPLASTASPGGLGDHHCRAFPERTLHTAHRLAGLV